MSVLRSVYIYTVKSGEVARELNLGRGLAIFSLGAFQANCLQTENNSTTLLRLSDVHVASFEIVLTIIETKTVR